MTNNLESTILNLPGFKISDSHFRVGSKIHISDFYYAKRFFQNGFFASRIAFILARDIAKIIDDKGLIDDIKKNGLTLIGYEMYSVLLLSLVDKFLRIKLSLSHEQINHNLFEDSESLNLCKAFNIHPNVLILVPIASTFSTAIKIENQLLKLYEKQFDPPRPLNIIQPHFNVLYISDHIPTDNLTEIEISFGWAEKDIDKKTISLWAYYANTDANTIRPQKYYLSVPTRWFNVQECQRCNPVDAHQKEHPEFEYPLYETDRTAVTPSMIFDFPKGRLIEREDLKRKYYLDGSLITYGHHTRNKSHFLYAVNSEAFLEKNKGKIQEWLTTIRSSEQFKATYRDSDHVIIIAACHYSNAGFIDLINEYLFSASANIIHYDPSNDYIQNFSMVYGKEINDADKVVFIDDSLKSGNAFDKIYQFVQNTFDTNPVAGTDENLNKLKGISCCFFLLNKSQPPTFFNVKKCLVNEQKIYAFANLHLYTSLKTDDISTLEIEEERYLELAGSCYLDSLKVHFLNQAKKLNAEKTYQNIKGRSVKQDRHLAMLIATHRIFEYFRVAKQPVLNSFSGFMADLISKTESPIEEVKSVYVTTKIFSETDTAYLKVLTQLPFTQYKPLKSKVFTWVIALLLDLVDDIKKEISSGKFNYTSFQELKFLIRRAGLLNSNYLFSKGFFQFINMLYSEKGIPFILAADYKILNDAKKKSRQDLYLAESVEHILKLKDFHVFFVAQIKELLLKNESRCIRIEKNLVELERSESPNIRQIVRMLQEENSIIIGKLYDQIKSNLQWKEIFVPRESDKTDVQIEYSNEKIKEFLNDLSISYHHRFQSLDLFYKMTNELPVVDNKSFLNYLWLQYFFQFDKRKKKINLNDKTDYILSKIIELFNDYGLFQPGAFFIVNDSQQAPFFAYNRNHHGTIEIDSSKWSGDDMEYLRDYLKGEENKTLNDEEGAVPQAKKSKSPERKKHFKTIIEFKRNTGGEWEDLYSTSLNKIEKKLGKDIISIEHNRLILIRLSKREYLKPDRPQGIIGIYYQNDEIGPTNINIIRYLLLLRESLSVFIENHHENDEFTNWQIAQIKQRTSLLTGHGKEMLINIAINRGDTYKDIVSTLLKVQRLLIDKKEEAEEANKMNLPHSRVSKIFTSFFKDPDKAINEDFFFGLSVMATDVFGFEEIENVELLPKDNIFLKVEPGISFRFDMDLLKMFCFEILVNAKKNRWLFLDEQIHVKESEIISNNIVWIEAKRSDGRLVLKISNTGPGLDRNELRKVQQKKNIKRYDNSSGIELINTVLQEFELGEIGFHQERIKNELYRFDVTLKLNENVDETSKEIVIN